MKFPKKNTNIGIIPHLNDLNSNFIFDFYKANLDNSILINIKDDPIVIINQIASCHKIISSSLHGLIVADSFGISNLWIENIYKHQDYEPRFKFHDYYSTFDITDIKPLNIIELRNLSIYEDELFNVVDNQKVKANQKKLINYLTSYFDRN